MRVFFDQPMNAQAGDTIQVKLTLIVPHSLYYVYLEDPLPAGTYVYTYQMQASVAGEFHVMPTHAAEFYFPETWGRSSGELFTITQK